MKDFDSLLKLVEHFYVINKIKDWSVIEIETSKLPDYFRLFKDLNFIDKSFYTLNNVSPFILKVIDKIVINLNN